MQVYDKFLPYRYAKLALQVKKAGDDSLDFGEIWLKQIIWIKA